MLGNPRQPLRSEHRATSCAARTSWSLGDDLLADGEVVPSIKDIFLAHFAQAMHFGEALFEVVVVVRGASMRVDNRDDLLELGVAILERLPFNPPSAAAGSEGFQFFS